MLLTEYLEDEELLLARVDWDSEDLDFDDDLALVRGEPFTGVIYELHSNGQLGSLSRYLDGLPNGLQQSWYPNGQRRKESFNIRGNGIAWSRLWHPNGKLQKVVNARFVFPIRVIEWDEDGILISDDIINLSSDKVDRIKILEQSTGFSDWKDYQSGPCA